VGGVSWLFRDFFSLLTLGPSVYCHISPRLDFFKIKIVIYTQSYYLYGTPDYACDFETRPATLSPHILELLAACFVLPNMRHTLLFAARIDCCIISLVHRLTIRNAAAYITCNILYYLWHEETLVSFPYLSQLDRKKYCIPYNMKHTVICGTKRLLSYFHAS
jgi:hypothetical protein